MKENVRNQPSSSGLLKTVRTALLIVAVILGGLTAWAWLSSESDSKLPFDYEGFD